MPITEPMPKPAAPRTLHLKGGRQGVLLFHGLSSSPLELQFLARGLQRGGHTVRVPVIEGYTHGLTEGQPKDIGPWLASALKELDTLLAECDTVAVGGLCLGAIIALRVAALRSDRLSGVMALSPALRYDGWGNPWFARLWPLARYVPFAPRIRIRERWPFGLKDERMRTWIERQMNEAGASDAGASTLRVGDILKARRLTTLARRSLSDITCPTLLIHAKEDECATPRSSFEIASRVQADRIRCVLLSDSYHMVSIDREKALVLSEMLQFLGHAEAKSQASRPERFKVLPLFETRAEIRP